MAEYRDGHEELRAVGAEVAAVSVDPPHASEKLRSELQLPFPLLCDPNRKVITSWGLLNPKEHGGIAYPSVFLLDPGLLVRYRSLDGTIARIRTGGLLDFLRTGGAAGPAKPPRRIPIYARAADWRKGLRNFQEFRRSR